MYVLHLRSVYMYIGKILTLEKVDSNGDKRQLINGDFCTFFVHVYCENA